MTRVPVTPRAMNKWDARFIDMALLVSSWSKDTTQVGAVIASPDRRIVSVGYNGFPQGVDDTILSRDQKLLRTIHAESNAMHFANRDLEGCSIYITHPPCSHCAAHIIQRGIVEVVFIEPDKGFVERWKESSDEARSMFVEAGVRVYAVSNQYIEETK